jgi:lysophospholipase L1-like esterase
MDLENNHCPLDKYQAHTRLFEALAAPVDWVFLGDSITNAGRWSELFPEKKVANHGIDGDTVKGMLGRLEIVLEMKPEKVFLMGGINDLTQFRTPNDVFEQYRQILERLLTADIEPVIQSTLHTQEGQCREQVNALNCQLEAFAAAHNLKFIDVNAVLAVDGILKSEVNYDGVHLHADAYLAWRKEIVSAL